MNRQHTTHPCPKCGAPATKYLCDKHHAAYRNMQRERHARRKAIGLCVCGRTPTAPWKRCERCRAIIRSHYSVEKSAARRKRLRDETFVRYGGYVCACCGEREPQFLQLDHINNNGAEHRKTIGRCSGDSFYKWLKNNGYPPGYQVLCANCNFAKGRYGRCPHTIHGAARSALAVASRSSAACADDP
jgi:hypothetical protein